MITPEMTINEILELKDDVMDVFLAHGLPCHGCPGGVAETLAEAAESHSVDLMTLLNDLNACL